MLTKGIEDEMVGKIPIARKYFYSVSSRENLGEYVKKRDRVFIAERELKQARLVGDKDRIAKAKKRYKEELKIVGKIRAMNSARNRLIRQKRKIEDHPRMDEDRKTKLLDNIDKKIQDIIAKANKAMKDI
jgi:hypothetical protein